jgi:multiple sugar transport system substrate-binding protein
MVNAASPRKEATWEFLKWLSGPEGSLIYTQSGGLSPHQEVLSRPEIESSIPWLDELARATEDGVGSLRHAEANAIREIFDRWISQAVAGIMEVDDALSNAGRELRSFLGPNEACEQ